MVAAFRLHAGRCAHDKFLTAAYSMDINFRTHHSAISTSASTVLSSLHFQECRVSRMEVLRTDAENHRLSGVFRHQLVRELALRQRDELPAKLTPYAFFSLFDRAVDEVHLRRTDKAGYKHIAGLVVEVCRRIGLLNDTALHNNDTVAIVIASVWSCVT